MSITSEEPNAQPYTPPFSRFGGFLKVYRGSSLIRNSDSLGLYSRTILKALWWFSRFSVLGTEKALRHWTERHDCFSKIDILATFGVVLFAAPKNQIINPPRHDSQSRGLRELHCDKTASSNFDTRVIFEALTVGSLANSEGSMPLHYASDRGFPEFVLIDIRLPEKGNSNSHGARPVHQIKTNT